MALSSAISQTVSHDPTLSRSTDTAVLPIAAIYFFSLFHLFPLSYFSFFNVSAFFLGKGENWQDQKVAFRKVTLTSNNSAASSCTHSTEWKYVLISGSSVGK